MPVPASLVVPRSRLIVFDLSLLAMSCAAFDAVNAWQRETCKCQRTVEWTSTTRPCITTKMRTKRSPVS